MMIPDQFNVNSETFAQDDGLMNGYYASLDDRSETKTVDLADYDEFENSNTIGLDGEMENFIPGDGKSGGKWFRDRH